MKTALKASARTAREISRLAAHELYAMLSSRRRQETMDIVDDYLRLRTLTISPQTAIDDFCGRVNRMGLPLDRYASSTTVLTPEHDAMRWIWLKDRGVTENAYIQPPGDDPTFEHSPFYEAAQTGEWVELWLPETPDERFGIVRELKEEGFTHYLCIPFFLSNNANGWLALATKAAAGFDAEDLATIALIAPGITRLIDARIGWNTLDRLLRTYVGDEPHRAILNGNVKRGQVTTIRSAILFADMRDSTGHTADLSAVAAVDLFNAMFDRLVPPIETRQGEILKYLGDGLLAIFREGQGHDHDAAGRALAAAEDALASLDGLNAERAGLRPIQVGIALHYGEAAYGNVGSGLRLDFTVIGRDVGLASRIGTMNARLGEPLLLSEAFVERLRRPVVPLGAFAARGFPHPLAVFRPTSPGDAHAGR